MINAKKFKKLDLMLHSLIKDLREALDHNELLEFQIAEMEHSHRVRFLRFLRL